ncbi:UDP-2,4-diacetamido-2,4,6-trideoxy-beta-L-altropyranose hydrolase [Propionispira arboris]|uniref:UDP-2,4-diacetamido-2,4,6-trideoxy-beta-L-altropyranose hydrolase n=1 Tax=Propionispira arboris TaxID=84035 RepID=A0A1H7CLH7_9FIRM|nr:UDP-2,4-diacetamido-2,4,6-trideoxy-beta-L-altropyranose hydrolase [Propionispira arboris]SEJ87972.1 UDP-2,4-diacetamido-2,4,6-trideoxy-beta-L-altropyranose hydrolase [Propionispira arboris]
MNIVFRVDSSTQIGSGHVMRCITLAGKLRKENNAEIMFISRDLPGNLNDVIQKKGYSLIVLPQCEPQNEIKGYEKWLTVTQQQDANACINVLQKQCKPDYLIVDSYAINEEWEKKLRPFVHKIMVIDDLANRRHDCDVLLDQNFYLNKNFRYKGLVPSHCQLLLGPKYVLLREEFYEAQKKMRKRDGKIYNILIFYGGSDLTNETMKALRALAMLSLPKVLVNVIVGEGNPYKDEVAEFCQQHEFMKYYCQVDNMAEFMNQADLTLGAGGTTTWERCFLGLPAVVTSIADNQIQICKDCAEARYVLYLGSEDFVTEEIICKFIEKIFFQSEMLLTLKIRSFELGKGDEFVFLFD